MDGPERRDPGVGMCRNPLRIGAALGLLWLSPAQGEDEIRAVRIMPLGDSITQGNWRHDSYRRELWQLLKGHGYVVDFVGTSRWNHWGPPPHTDFDRDHEGHWGWRIDEVLPRIAAWAAEAAPDIVLIHLGTNDVLQGEDPQDVARELGELIAALRRARPGVACLVAELIPAHGMTAEIRGANAAIRRLVSLDQPGERVIVVDQYAGFDVARMTYDGVHPNVDGERHLAARWNEVLAPLLAGADAGGP